MGLAEAWAWWTFPLSISILVTSAAFWCSLSANASFKKQYLAHVLAVCVNTIMWTIWNLTT